MLGFDDFKLFWFLTENFSITCKMKLLFLTSSPDGSGILWGEVRGRSVAEPSEPRTKDIADSGISSK
ncbi:hypothetical protein SAMN05660477_03013 [Soonwooa buanensis]|uniref:Uncharacterized protein n=1 Tax=Soonwooa buanensis TaxID=619805 RepID=A0A1T5GP13_9FLAO|nr:hypothetical protein SAMN05660477_03013 [Soonwooa buanensis]